MYLLFSNQQWYPVFTFAQLVNYILLFPIHTHIYIYIYILGFNEVGGFDGLWRKYPLAIANVTDGNSTCGGGIHPQWDSMLRDLSDPDFPWLGIIVGGIPAITWYLCADQVPSIFNNNIYYFIRHSRHNLSHHDRL